MAIISNDSADEVLRLALTSTGGDWVQWKDHPIVYAVTGKVIKNTSAVFQAEDRRLVAHCADASDADDFWNEKHGDKMAEREAERHGRATAAFLAQARRAVINLVESLHEARGLYKDLLKQVKNAPVSVVYCVYCGGEYPAGTPQAKSKVLYDHISQCEKHPMKTLVEMAKELDDLNDKDQRLPTRILHLLEEWKKER